jgi:alpha-beta hydrolase superfamily lysophospholipase
VSDDRSPLYFPSGDQTLFGWLHPARGAATSDAGVVICSPFGYETVCAHRSLRAFADICAASGMPALRFDYSGTGDSSGSVGEADQIAGWCDDIRAAIKVLERTCGVRRICLVGVRLGALLAGLVAAQGAIDAVIAVAPVTNGRRYLRELRALRADTSAGTAGAAPADEAGPVTAEVGLDVTGFRLSQVSVESLERIDLSKLSAGPRTAVLILDRDDLPGAKPWAAALETEGVEVRYEALPGFTDMVSTPHAAVVPAAMTGAMAQWLEHYRRRAEPAEPKPTRISPQAPAHMRIKDESGVDLIERAMFIDGERTLFAIVTEPAERAVGGDTHGCGVVMLNGGATNHIGPNRMYVELSRCWAARGYVVLRLDLAGLGDSATRPGEDNNQVYPPGALYDVGVAIEFLRRRRGVRNVTLAGLCAGAYHALRSAISGLPVSTVLLVNPLTFYWKQGSTLNDLQISEVVRNPGVYAENSFSLQHWSKLLRSRVKLWRVAMVFLRRGWLTVDSALRDLCRKLRIRIPDDLGWDLQSVAARGIRIVFFFARGEAGSELLKVQGGSVLKRLGDRCHVHTIDGADHIFTQRAARMRLLQLLSSELPH